MIESCRKNLLVIFCPNLFNRNCSQKSKESLQKSHKVTRTFTATTTKKNHPDKYRNNNKNYKVSKSLDL